MPLQYLSSSFSSIWLTVWEEMSFEEFQDGRHDGHLGYRNGTILAILNLYVAPVPPIKFRLNPTYSLGGDVVLRISRWPLWRTTWISELDDFSNSGSLCRSDASHQVSAQSDLWFGRRCRLKKRNGTILAILTLHLPQWLPLSFSSIQLMFLEMSKMWKANDGRRATDDGRRTSGHGISWPGAKLQLS